MTASNSKQARATVAIGPPNFETHAPMGTVSVSLALLSVVLWGGTAVANQFAIDVYPPIFVGAIRFGLAAIFMLVWCFLEGSPLVLQGKQWGVALILGCMMFFQIGTFNYGTGLSSASHATVLVNSYVFWVAAYEALIIRTIHLRWYQTFGLFLAGAGVILLVSTADAGHASAMDQPTLRGDLILALSGLTLGIKILVVKWATKFAAPASLIFWHDIFGTALLFLFSGVYETHSGVPLNTEAVVALLFGGIVISGFCFVLNAKLLQKHGASQVSVFSFVTPICGILLAYLLRGDHLSWWLILAGVFVASGIFLVNYTARSTPES